MTSRPTAEDLLDRVIPFQFLPAARRKALVPRLEERHYAAGEVILHVGETSRDVHLLAVGVVEAVDEAGPRPRVVSTIEPGHYFGERAPLFDKPRRITIRARTEVVTFSLTGRDFLALVAEEPVFAQALAHTLKVKQGIFLAYRRLFARMLSLIDTREFLLSELIPAYRELAPALHPGMDERAIDTGALSYAVARLPEDVTCACFYYLTCDLPPLYADPDSKFEPVATKARRRAAWRPIKGKLIVLLRDSESDAADMLTCLCLYAIEAKKIRHRIRASDVLVELRDLAAGADRARTEAFLARLDLSPEERAGLLRIWPTDLCGRLRDIVLHHEDVAVEIDSSLDNYNTRAAEVWVTQIRDHVRRLVDLEAEDLDVHIVSSNTHSVGNCLSPFLSRRRDEVLAWGRQHLPDVCGEPSPDRPWGRPWASQDDLVFVLVREWLQRTPGALEQKQQEERAAGHHRLTATAFTGIEVDLFDLRRLVPEHLDPRLGARRLARPAIIVNVDFAFGQQAEEILASLLFVFGRRVRSVNVLGKAGGLVGRRGDLQLPNAVLMQTNDELYPLPNHDLPAEVLQRFAPGLTVHRGPILTVAGTLLQDRILLQFYRRIWKAVGLEMEGSFFARELISAIATGVCRDDVESRFAYYTSDVPLNAEENLSEALTPWEGVPALYAITRAVLSRIFADGE